MRACAERPRVRQRWATFGCALLALASVGCKTFTDSTVRIRSALDANDPNTALAASNKALGVETPEETPPQLKDGQALLLLNRAMVFQVLERYDASSSDFQTADKAIEVLDFSRSTSHEISRYLFSDSAGPYKARPYEKLLINALNMVNYLASGDLQGAKVEARRFTVMRDFLKSGKQAEAAMPATALGSYLAGFTYEQAGERDEALRYYDEALQAGAFPGLSATIQRLMKRATYRTARLTEVAKSETPQADGDAYGDVLVVVSHGRVPGLRAVRLPVGAALVIAGIYLPPGAEKEARRLAAQGLVTWVNYPELENVTTTEPAVRVSISNAAHPTDTANDVTLLAREAWKAGKPRVVAAAVVRMIARGAIGAGVGTATGKGTDKGGLGMLAAVIAQGAMVAADKPDTRSWDTLPSKINVARTRLPPGNHTITVDIGGRQHVRQFTVAPSGWTVINITDLSRR